MTVWPFAAPGNPAAAGMVSPMSLDHFTDEDRLVAAAVGLGIAVVIFGIVVVLEGIKARFIWW